MQGGGRILSDMPDSKLTALISELDAVDEKLAAIVQAGSTEATYQDGTIRLLTLGQLRQHRDTLVRRIAKRRADIAGVVPYLSRISYQAPEGD